MTGVVGAPTAFRFGWPGGAAETGLAPINAVRKSRVLKSSFLSVSPLQALSALSHALNPRDFFHSRLTRSQSPYLNRLLPRTTHIIMAEPFEDGAISLTLALCALASNPPLL